MLLSATTSRSYLFFRVQIVTKEKVLRDPLYMGVVRLAQVNFVQPLDFLVSLVVFKIILEQKQQQATRNGNRMKDKEILNQYRMF